MGLYESILRPLAFRMDPERAHEIALKIIARGWVRAKPIESKRLTQTLFGTEFANPLGLAAGFDKNGIALDHWRKMRFGFVETGTVTLGPQPGNDKPRMFRLREQQALINRLGFNNEGAQALSKRLAEARPEIPVGINIGKNKDVPLSQAASDYANCFRRLCRQGNYFVVNVSSPNTPGLRDLQGKERLWEIFLALREVDATRPMLVKIAPDLSWPEIDDIVEVTLRANFAGFVATNTTIAKPKGSPEGGLSGRPLKDRAQEVLGYLYRNVPNDMILIGVGGIFDGNDLFDRIAAGAHLCQMYTGFVYNGPSAAGRALQGLVERMEQEKVYSLSEVRGVSAI